MEKDYLVTHAATLMSSKTKISADELDMLKALIATGGTPTTPLPPAPPPKACIPCVPAVKNPPPKKLLFLHGYGDSPELAEAFQLGGFQKAFPGIKCSVVAGPIKLTTKDFDDMPKGELRDMAMAGDIDVYCHARTGSEESKAAHKAGKHDPALVPAVDSLEKRLLKDGGYDILAGFSQGGQVIYQLLDRLPALNKRLANPVRMVAMWGSGLYETPPPAHHMEGKVKAFVCQGEADSGHNCDACREKIDGDMYNCDVCADFDLCVKCYKEHAVAVTKLRAGMKHTVHHAMTFMPFDTFAVRKHQIVDKLSENGVEVQTSRCVGGHAMPQPEDKCYALFSKFYLGQASTEKPGTKPDIDPELLAKIEANFERGKADSFYERPGNPLYWAKETVTGKGSGPPEGYKRFGGSRQLTDLLSSKTSNGKHANCTLSQREWDALGSFPEKLLAGHFVQVGTSYYMPAQA